MCVDPGWPPLLQPQRTSGQVPAAITKVDPGRPLRPGIAPAYKSTKGRDKQGLDSTAERITGGVHHPCLTAVFSRLTERETVCSGGFREQLTVVSLPWGRGLGAYIFL